MEKEWLDMFFSYPELFPNKTGQSACPAGPPLFGGRFDYPEERDTEPKNLGLGWLYYSLARLYSIHECVCIGSGRGFAPILFAKGIKDNGGGKLFFVDPSFDDDFWKDPLKVSNWFYRFGVSDVIEHYRMTTEEFTKTREYQQLKGINLVYIDGGHFYEFVKFDFEAFVDNLSENGLIIFHDSISRSLNPKWHGPRKLIQEVIDSGKFQIFDFKYGAGLTLLQKISFIQTVEYTIWCADEQKDDTSINF